MIEINNLMKEKIDKRFLEKIAKIVLEGEGLEKENISIAFIDGKTIKKINKKYRGKNKETDVLSFQYTSKFKTQMSKPQLKTQNFLQKKEDNFLGEVVICSEAVKKNAKNLDLSYNKPSVAFSKKAVPDKELARVLIHGILHIIGYDHERSKTEAEKMEKKQEYYLKRL